MADSSYPYSIKLPLSRGYISIISWLERVGITEYNHESFIVDTKPYVTYLFKQEADAVHFALKWS